MNSQRKVITVDGVGASGKSALARLLAQRLGFAHLNSGLLYRATAFLVRMEGCDETSNDAVEKLLNRHSIELRYDPERGSEVLIDGTVRDAELATQENSRLASVVAKLPSVRSHFVQVQRDAFAPRGVVAEGRDMGTIIFPDASIKFFITADLKIRAARRCSQLQAQGQVANAQEIELDLARRDESDANRELSPMKAADDAIVVDNSHGTLDETVERMYQAVTAKG